MSSHRVVLTADRLRSKAVLKALTIMLMTYLGVWFWMGTVVPFVTSFPAAASELAAMNVAIVYVAVGTVIAVVILLRQPDAIFPRPRLSTFDNDQRRLVRRLRKNWVETCRRANLSRELGRIDHVRVEVPKVKSTKPVPLGVEVQVRTIPGQAAEEICAASNRLGSAFGLPVRASIVDPMTVCLTAVMHDPLRGIRAARSSTTTRIVIGRCDDGTEAILNLADPSHIAVQGMTRSGKSALLNTILGQVLESDAVRVSGIDPNRVLLGPLAESARADPSDYVLGDDPAAALALLDRLCQVMDERAHLLTDLGIPQHEDFTADFPVRVVVLEEYAGLLRQAAAYDDGLKPAERTAPKIRQRVGRLVSEGAKSGMRVILITQRAEASIIDGDTRGQFGTRITMGVDNGDSVRLLHPQASPETVDAVIRFPVGRCLFWQHRIEKFVQADFTPYDEYRRRLGLAPTIEEENE